MKVISLSQHFSDLATLLGSSGAKKELLDDFAALGRGLLPFADLELKQFADFLVQAEDYSRTGLLPTTAKSGKKTPTPRPVKAAGVSAEEVASKVRDLYERAANPDMTSEVVESELLVVDALSKKPDLLIVAKVVSADAALKNKTIPLMKEGIKKAVRDMWDESQRLRQ